MFLNLLTPSQQSLFVKSARVVAEQDGRVAAVEESLLASVLAECELDEDPGETPVEDLVEQAPELLDSPAARAAFLLELAGVAVIDGHAGPAELAGLKKFGDALEVGDDQLAELVRFASDARDLVTRGQMIIASAGG